MPAALHERPHRGCLSVRSLVLIAHSQFLTSLGRRPMEVWRLVGNAVTALVHCICPASWAWATTATEKISLS